MRQLWLNAIKKFDTAIIYCKKTKKRLSSVELKVSFVRNLVYELNEEININSATNIATKVRKLKCMLKEGNHKKKPS